MLALQRQGNRKAAQACEALRLLNQRTVQTKSFLSKRLIYGINPLQPCGGTTEAHPATAMNIVISVMDDDAKLKRARL